MNPDRPNIKVMAANISQTAKNVINGALNGGPIFTSEEKSNARLNICNECEFFAKETARCKKCGCFMKAKVKIEMAKCPIGKW